jgi:hypothetical protein
MAKKKRLAKKATNRVSDKEYQKIDPLTGKRTKHIVKTFPGRPRAFDDADVLWTECITYIEQCEKQAVPPTMAGMAGFMGCSKRTLNEYMKGSYDTDDANFSRALELARTIIEDRKLRAGLQKSLDSGLVKFDLVNNHGYTEKVSSEVTGKDGGPVETRDVSDMEFARRIAWLFHKAQKEATT